MDILVISSVILFAFIAIIRLDWALFLLLAALPSYLIRFNIGPIPFTFLETMIIIVFVVWLFKAKPWLRLKKGHWQTRREKYPYHLEIVLILIAAWVALAVAGFSDGAMGIFKAYFLEPIMLYIVIINQGKGSEKKFIWPLAISAAIISAVAIFQQISGAFIFNEFWANLDTRRVTSVFAYPNAIGLYLAPIFFLIIALFLSYPKRSSLLVSLKKLALILIGAGILAAIFFARSEGALIAIVLSFLLVAFLDSKRSRLIALAITIAAVASLVLYSPAWQYAVKKTTLMDLSGQIRRQQWQETMEMLSDSRLISGAGLNNYQRAVEPFHQEGIFVKNDDPEWHRHVVWNEEYRKRMWQPVEIYLYPHNIFLNFWTELGLMGAILFIWLIFRYFYDALKLLNKVVETRRYLLLGLIGAMSTLFIHGLVDVPYFKNDLSVLFWLLIALMGIIKLKHKKNI
jgi:O-antigen ligase